MAIVKVQEMAGIYRFNYEFRGQETAEVRNADCGEKRGGNEPDQDPAK